MFAQRWLVMCRSRNIGRKTSENLGQKPAATQRHSGSFGGTGQAKIPSKNAAPRQLWLFVQPCTLQLYCRGIFAWSILIESCPFKRPQAPLRWWLGPSFPLVFVMADCTRSPCMLVCTAVQSGSPYGLMLVKSNKRLSAKRELFVIDNVVARASNCAHEKSVF